jgi:peptidoglycan/LPS O-acetylase OafA/YrhL
MSQTATMSQNGSSRNTGLSRGGALDLLRFVAALFIVLYHVAERAPVSLFAIHPALGRGYLATDFFLMLSGYVLARTYGRASWATTSPPASSSSAASCASGPPTW